MYEVPPQRRYGTEGRLSCHKWFVDRASLPFTITQKSTVDAPIFRSMPAEIPRWSEKLKLQHQQGSSWRMFLLNFIRCSLTNSIHDPTCAHNTLQLPAADVKVRWSPESLQRVYDGLSWLPLIASKKHFPQGQVRPSLKPPEPSKKI